MKAWATILRCLAAGQPCALVSVAATQGSAPRDAGAHMVVTGEGYHGTIGGGTLEWRAIAAAQAMLGRGPGARLSHHALGPDLGQCCGGRVALAVEAFDAAQIAEVRALADREAAGPFAVARHGIELRFGEERRTVLLFGAGHVGRALVLALAPLPVAVRWIDPRPEAFPRAVPENVAPVAAADPVAEIGTAAPGSLVFIMSHSHTLDLALADAALRNPAVAHVGLIGSATKRARFEKRLRDAGVAADRIAALICPIGVPGIASKLPAAIAAATAAQILVLDAGLALASADEPSHAAAQQAGGRG